MLRPRPLDPLTALQREREARRRRNRARGIAYRMLASWHPDTYEELYTLALMRIHAEAGPLPGDPDE